MAETVSHEQKTLPRFRTGGYGAMVESEAGQYVRVNDVQALLFALRAFLPDAEKHMATTLLNALGGE